VTLRARWVTLRARWLTVRARWVTLRARWVTLLSACCASAGAGVRRGVRGRVPRARGGGEPAARHPRRAGRRSGRNLAAHHHHHHRRRRRCCCCCCCCSARLESLVLGGRGGRRRGRAAHARAGVRFGRLGFFPTDDLGYRGVRGAVGLGCGFIVYKRTLPSHQGGGGSVLLLLILMVCFQRKGVEVHQIPNQVALELQPGGLTGLAANPRSPAQTLARVVAGGWRGLEPAAAPLDGALPPVPACPAYCDQKVANRDIRVWHFVIENGY
jgi:hypothetical protein